MTVKSRYNIQKAVARSRKPPRPFPALVGDGNGMIEVPGSPGMWYVRPVGSELVIPVIQGNAPRLNNYPVWVGNDLYNRRWVRILGANIEGGGSGAGGAGGAGGDLEPHSHYLTDGNMTYISSRQIVELLLSVVSGMTVQISGGFTTVSGRPVYVVTQTLDLSSYVPVSGALWAIIRVDDAGALSVQEGTTEDSYADLNNNNMPAVEVGYKELWAVKLYEGQTAISGRFDSPDYQDLRFIQGGWDGLYNSDTAEDGAWRIIRSGDNLVVQRRESGSYVTMLTIGDDAKLTIGSGEAGVDYQMVVNGETNDLTLTYMEDEDYLKTSAVLRDATAKHRRYYHMPLFSSAPGGSGATYTAPGANTPGGYQLNAAGETLHLEADVHSDWDGASDPVVEVHFQVNVDNSGGGVGDTVDLKLICYYIGEGDTATKTQTVEVATVVGQAAQYTAFEVELPVDFDAGGNVVDAGDVFGFILNLETDTSEVDDIIVTNVAFFYNTTHIGIESGDT